MPCRRNDPLRRRGRSSNLVEEMRHVDQGCQRGWRANDPSSKRPIWPTEGACFRWPCRAIDASGRVQDGTASFHVKHANAPDNGLAMWSRHAGPSVLAFTAILEQSPRPSQWPRADRQALVLASVGRHNARLESVEIQASIDDCSKTDPQFQLPIGDSPIGVPYPPLRSELRKKSWSSHPREGREYRCTCGSKPRADPGSIATVMGCSCGLRNQVPSDGFSASIHGASQPSFVGSASLLPAEASPIWLGKPQDCTWSVDPLPSRSQASAGFSLKKRSGSSQNPPAFLA